MDRTRDNNNSNHNHNNHNLNNHNKTRCLAPVTPRTSTHDNNRAISDL